ncbi:hypothetical protein PNK_0487 [Candidatus Protochlamydia naegleriophila]|uniref:Uncharacterized protein n=1 Tax=Candidatus Protochlamydia naegleriophila TaxID=389348 RepID=A0A0U5EPX2_9BACT|nr:hypothetical protein PNK_0487 [Candidatus Protochlamydia naegleriophila]
MNEKAIFSNFLFNKKNIHLFYELLVNLEG